MSKITTSLLQEMVQAAATRLGKQAEYVNSLNVFPVPDGDTGTNMGMTMDNGAKAVADQSASTVGEVGQILSKGLLMGARGNSGVITSQLFRGFGQSIKDKTELDGQDLAHAFQAGVEVAYKAVMKPVEGTILTVSRARSRGCRLRCACRDPCCKGFQVRIVQDDPGIAGHRRAHRRIRRGAQREGRRQGSGPDDRLGRRKAAQQGLCGRHVLGDPLDAHREGRGLLRKEAAPARPAPFVLRVDPAALACGRRGCERDDALPLGLCRAPQALGYLLVSDRRPRAHGSGGRLVPPRDADGGGPGMKDILPQLLKGFFLQWMAAGRQLSPETVASYRDAFSLMLRWFRDERGTDASEVGMDDLTAENVEEFLLYLAERRGNSAQTVNCRLAAIKAFCSYAAYRAPERLAEMKRISDIP